MIDHDYRQWQGCLQQKLNELEERVKPIMVDIERTKRQLALMKELIQLENGALPATIESKDTSQERSTSIADVVTQILEQAAEPLHISRIKEQFLAMGRAIPGQGTESNLLSYIVRDPRFARVAKGTYTINSTGSARKPTKRPRRRRRAKTASAGQ